MEAIPGPEGSGFVIVGENPLGEEERTVETLPPEEESKRDPEPASQVGEEDGSSEAQPE